MSIIVTLTGPSCSGKTTLEAKLEATGRFTKVISHTTRAPRAGEVEGQSYYFISREAFEEMQNAGEFIESVEFNGNRYAVSSYEIDRAFSYGKDVVIVCEPEGAKQIRAYCMQTGTKLLQVFVDAPADVIAQRFLKRFLQDYRAAENTGTVSATKRVLEASGKRLGVMMTEERGWVKCASRFMETDLSRYDMMVPVYDEATEQTVITAILTS